MQSPRVSVLAVMVITILTIIIIPSSQCAKILGVFYWPTVSHYTLGARLMKELALRGHDVTFISPFLQKTPVKNLREIHVTGIKERWNEIKNQVNMFDAVSHPLTLLWFFVNGITTLPLEGTYAHENVQKLLNSNETFDLIIKEQFVDDAFLGLAHRFKAPAIVLSTMGPTSWINKLVRNPSPPSYVADRFLGYSPPMNFFQRTVNTVWKLFNDLVFLYIIYVQNNILHKYIPDAPHVQELMNNVSFVLINSHTSFDPPVPLMPNVALVGGFHVEPPKKLPEDLQSYLDDAKEGVVYFSMGSNLRDQDMPAEKRDKFIKAFSKLKVKILWKWDVDLPGKPSNVKTGKWLPQKDILAHPNVKAIITHGGLLTMIEAVYHGVPVIGIPVYGDQEMNMATAEKNGYGIMVRYDDVSAEKLGHALEEVLYNPKYRENAKMRSQLLHKQPMKPIDSAIYWVEYVINTNGASHLRSAALDLPWYQYLLLDVILFLTTVSFAVLSLFYILVKIWCYRKNKTKQKTN